MKHLSNLNTLDIFKQLLCVKDSDKIVIKQFASIGIIILMVSAISIGYHALIVCRNFRFANGESNRLDKIRTKKNVKKC